MYDPKGNGKDRATNAVQFVERRPPEHLSAIVHRFLELKTDGDLPEDYRFHALPDACAYIVFDQDDPRIAGVANLRAESEEFNLGRSFHFVNIRFLPGVWQGSEDLAYGMIDRPYRGQLPLFEVNRALGGLDLEGKCELLSKLVSDLMQDWLVVQNPITEKIFQSLDDIHSVADMADCAGLSPRQLQRRLKATTGFSPHDFLKVLRLQTALQGDTLSYADQSHFIHSFRKATGYTPGKYARKFDV